MKPQPNNLSCPSCQVLYINGVRYHEQGCPDAWKDYTAECFECGCQFKPEYRYQRYCPDCNSNPYAEQH